MEKGIDLKAKEFRDALNKLTIESGLPACILRMTLEKATQEMVNVENRMIEQEQKQYEEDSKNAPNQKSKTKHT